MPASKLARKLRIQPGQRVLILNPPAGYLETLGELPEGAEVVDSAEGTLSFVPLFAKDSTELKEHLPAAMDVAEYDGLFWISYPKGGSKVKTDLNRDVLWEFMVNDTELRPVTQVSVDSIWSAIRFRPKVEVGK